MVLGEAGNLVLGTITDSDPAITASDFSVQITPGDGSPVVTGMVTALATGFTASAWARPALAGHLDGAAEREWADGTASAEPRRAVWRWAPSMRTEWHPDRAQVNLGNPTRRHRQYSATINWGDGTSSAGTVSVVGGELTVQGTHAFAFDSLGQTGGAFQVSVQVSGSSGVLYTGRQPVVVVRPPLQVHNVGC